MIPKIAVYCFLFFLAFSNLTQAQDPLQKINISGQFREMPVSEFFGKISEKYHLQFYYKPEWIDSLRVNQDFNDVPLNELLITFLNNHKLSYKLVQGDVFVIPAIFDANRTYANQEEQLLTIGDPQNQGRFSRAILKGNVSDGKDGSSLPGAIVSVSDLDINKSTGGNGEFELHIPTGVHTIQVSFIGFESSIQKIRLLEDGSFQVELFEENHNIGEIKVLGDRSTVSRTQMSITKVNSKLIKELPALMGEADVIKSVIMMPGVQSVGELSAGFNVRGGNSDQNLVLMDGAPVYNTSHLFGFFSMINPDAVSGVTLYKGGLPASYGDRMASTMEVLLKEGDKKQLGFYGGIGIINSRLTLDGPLSKNSKSSFLIGGRSTYSDWVLKKINNLDLKNSVARFYDVNANVNLNLSANNSLKLMAYHSADEFNLKVNSLYKYTNSIAALNWKMKIGNSFISKLNTTYSNYRFSLEDWDKYNPEINYKLETGIENAGLKYQLAYICNENLSLEGGFQVSHYKIDPGAVSPLEGVSSIQFKKVSEEQALGTALFFESDWAITNIFSLTMGLRYSRWADISNGTIYLYDPNFSKSQEHIVDSISNTGNKAIKTYQGLEPRFGFKYALNSGVSLRCSYQRVNQFINQISNNSVISPADYWKIADYHIKPLVSDQLAVGYFRDYKLLGLETSVEVYYKHLTNLIEYKNGAHLVMNENLETDLFQIDGYAYGMEFFIKKNIGRVNGMLSYTYSRTMRKSDRYFESERVNKGKYYPSVYDKPNDLSVSANYQISRRWRLSGNFVASSGRPVTLPELVYNYGTNRIIYYSDRNKYRMPSYHRLDLSLTMDENLKKKRSWKGSWTISVYNVYGRHNPYSIYYQRDTHSRNERVNYGLFKFSVIGIPIPSLTYNFKF